MLPGLWPSAAFRPGARINTSDTIDKVNRLQLTARGDGTVRQAGAEGSACMLPIAVHVQGAAGRDERDGSCPPAGSAALLCAASVHLAAAPPPSLPLMLTQPPPPRFPRQLQGIGTSANILQRDIVSCGPSVVHVVDQVGAQAFSELGNQRGCWHAQCRRRRRIAAGEAC